VEKREPEAASGKLVDVVVLSLVFKEAPKDRKHPRLLIGVEGVDDGAGITETQGCTRAVRCNEEQEAKTKIGVIFNNALNVVQDLPGLVSAPFNLKLKF